MKRFFQKYAPPLAWLLGAGIVLAFGPGCAFKLSECNKIQLAIQLSCPVAPASSECVEAKKLLAERCGGEEPPTPATCAATLCGPGTFCVEDPEKGARCEATPTPAPSCPEACPGGEECVDPVQGCKPIPPPPSLECPIVLVNAIENGNRQYKAGLHVGKIYDSTPRVCGDEAASIAVGRPGQYCVPLGPEGEPSFRAACEELFNYGPTPKWEGRGGATVVPGPLEWQVAAKGVGQIRVCDRKGRTCSPWIEVS